MKNLNLTSTILMMVFAVMLLSINDRESIEEIEKHDMLRSMTMIKNAEITPILREGSCEGDYAFRKGNRSIGKMESYPHSDPSIGVYWRFVPEHCIPREYSHLTSITDILMNGWYSRDHVYGDATYRKFDKFIKTTDVASLIRSDKLEGGPKWQSALVSKYLESDGGDSECAKKANNFYGIKCNEHTHAEHKAFVLKARKDGVRVLFNYNSQGEIVCYWGGGDLSKSEGKRGQYVHYQYFKTEADCDRRHAEIMAKPRYEFFENLPFNYEISVIKVKTYNEKKTNYFGEIMKDGKEYALTNADWHFLGRDLGYYASNPMHATTLAGIYFRYFGDWTPDDFILFENELVPELGQNLNRNEFIVSN